MYIVNVVYGMEHYQQENQSFDNYEDALDYNKLWQLKNPLSIKLYQELQPNNQTSFKTKFFDQFTIEDIHTMQYALECEYGVSDELANKLQLFLTEFGNIK